MKLLYSILMLACISVDAQPLPYQRAIYGHRVRQQAQAQYVAYSATFAGDGQCWLERDANLTGNADGNAGTVSVWVDFSGLDATTQYFFWSGAGKFTLVKRTTNLLRLVCSDAGSTVLVQLDQNAAQVAALTAAQGWHHIMASWDRSVDDKAFLYIDGVSCATITTFLSTTEDTDPINYSTDMLDMTIGATTSGNTPLAGCLSELYISYTFSDLSDASVRARFYSADGPPGDLSGYNSPIVYLKGEGAGFIVNSGSGGNFVKKGTTDLSTCVAP